MPKTLPERIFFIIVMAAIMVYGMIVYNVALNTNGVTNATFVMALHEMPIMVPVAFVLEFFVVEKLATKLAFLFMRPTDRPQFITYAISLMEMLKQPLCQPKSDAEQVVILVLASHGLLDTLPTAEQREKTAAFVRQFRADVSGTMQKIDADGKLEPDRVDAILNAWKAYAGGNDHVVQ